MRWTDRDIPDQSGRVAIVTGANTGIGYETALGLVRHGARVLLACRDPSRGRAAVERILTAHPGGKAEFLPLDLSQLESVRRFAERIQKDGLKVDLLINNAGVMVPPRSFTREGFELQIGVNHLGHYALTALLFDNLQDSPSTRIVTVSSLAHRTGRLDLDSFRGEKPYDALGGYRQSKLANLMFAIELDRRLSRSRYPYRSLAAHPGITKTDLVRSRPLLNLLAGIVGMPAWKGALPTLFAATDAKAEGGGYYGPDGFAEMRGFPAPARVMPRAMDEQMADRLWKLSEELTGVPFPIT